MTDQTESQPADEQQDEMSRLSRSWWDRYSPHGESVWSSALSFTLHVFIILVVLVGTVRLMSPDPEPPQVDVIAISDDTTGAPGDSEAAAIDDTLAEDVEQPDDLPPEMLPEELETLEEPEDVVIEVQEHGTEPLENPTEAQELLDRVRSAKSRLEENLTGKGRAGDPGTGAKGRAARVARWILHFDTRSPKNYLEQIDGLGATVAFPVEGGEFRYFEHCGSPNPSSKVKDLAGEGRLYWYDDNRASVAGVCQALGIPPTGMMVCFLPKDLEEKMLRLELAYNNLEEDEIASTHFKAVRRGGRLDVVVISQVPK